MPKEISLTNMNYDSAALGRNGQDSVPFRRNPNAYGSRLIFLDA
jgi:hypothetical protein